ncbi:MAG TPA: hypothetical protein VJ869_05110 [Sphaerochaeta sp.]|nr:hypothetical protein [Sphaerochaeta sp.]
MINLLKTHKDKVLHFLGCFFLASIWLPLGIVFAIGKEVYDWFKYGKETKGFWKMALGDLTFDALGIACATLIPALFVFLLG